MAISPENAINSLVPWYAIYTRHQHERVTANSLERSGVEVFLPLYETVRKWSDRKKRISLPLFPCYVFLRCGFERRVRVLTLPGVHFFVSFSDEPARIPESEIAAIRTVVQSGIPVEPHPFLQNGDRVRVKSGPLADVEGIFVRRKNSYRLVLSCGILGKSVSVEVDAFNVHRLSSSPSVLLSDMRGDSNQSLAG